MEQNLEKLKNIFERMTRIARVIGTCKRAASAKPWIWKLKMEIKAATKILKEINHDKKNEAEPTEE